MPYTPDTPLPTDYLNTISQPIFRQNFNQLNISFGIDHYPFSDLTANNGFHNQVTNPLIVGAVHPATATNVPKLYGMQDSANIGVLQYSRGGGSAVPTPLTSLHAGPLNLIAGNPATPILDFTGIPLSIFVVYVFNKIYPVVNPFFGTNVVNGFWNGTSFILNQIPYQQGTGAPYASSLVIGQSGSVLNISNNNILINSTEIYLTLEFKRLQ
jgi:hypothetical protein